MPRDLRRDLKAAFDGREIKGQPQTGEVPERIKNHAPAPVLRPGGSWKARADAVDQKVREAQDAAKARKEWAARIKTERKQSMGMSFRRRARP
jgi:hypothetical protein